MRQLFPHITLLLMLALSCAPDTTNIAEQIPAQKHPNQRNLVVVIHGGGDSPEDWANDLIEVMATRVTNPDTWAYSAIDWHADAEDRMSAARTGFRLGEDLGEELAAQQEYTHIVFIAHSVGSFVAHGALTTLDEHRENQTVPTTHVIFLDPFTARGVVRWNYGDSRFGKGADVAQTYLNSDDSAPSTNDAPAETYTIDVTQLRPDDYPEDRWHWWPIDAWQHLLLNSSREDVGLHALEQSAEHPSLFHKTYPQGSQVTLK